MPTRCLAVVVLLASVANAAAAPASQPAEQDRAARRVRRQQTMQAAASRAATKAPASRPRPAVEAVRYGVRYPAVADTMISFYTGKGLAENERLWNYGSANRLKLKGFEEYTLLKFDTAPLRGTTVRRATLYLPRTEQCEPAVIGVSTVSTDWVEGTGQGAAGGDGATALQAGPGNRPWAGSGSNMKWVVYGEGGSAYGASLAGHAADGQDDYVSVDLPPDVIHGLLVDGDSYGLCLTEEKGQRAFNKTYIDPPNPNHFIEGRESGRAAFLVVEGEPVDTTPPAPIGDARAEAGSEAGEIILTWTCPADDGDKGGKVLGYRVYLSTEKLAAETLSAKTLLPRHLTYRPKEPGQRQVFPVYGLTPGAPCQFAVVAYDEAGNASKPVFFSGRTREVRQLAPLQPHEVTLPKGKPLAKGPLRVWAAPSNSKINPVTGNCEHEGAYAKAESAGEYRDGNSVWDGQAHRAVLFAGRNDFAGFQLALHNTGERPLTDITVSVKGIWRDDGMSIQSIEAARVELFWQWSCRDKDGVYWPDALLPLDGPLAIPNPANRIQGQAAQPLYVDVYVPHTTAPGSYVAALQIAAAGVEPFVVPIDLTVWDFTLPDTLSFLANMYSYNLPTFTGDRWQGALDMYRLAHRNRLNVKVIPHNHNGTFTNPYMAMEATGKGKDRRIVSFEQFDRHYGPLLTGEAFADCPRKGVPVADVTLPIFENFPCTLKDGFAWDPYGVHLDIRQDFTQDYADGFVAVCRQMADHFRKKGYTKSVFEVVFRSKYQYAPTTTFWLLDEPMFRDDYLAINYFAGLTRKGFADAAPLKVRTRIDCSRIEESHGLMDEVDVLCGTMGNLREYYRPMRDFRLSYVPGQDGRPRTIWTYGGTNRVNTSNVANRAWSIEAWLFGSDSVLPWLAFGPDAAYDKAEEAGEAVFYPGARFGHNGVHGSLRMKAFRDGQQDVECLVLLAEKLGATRRELAGLLTKVADVQGEFTVERPEAAETISYGKMTPDDLERLRRTVGYNLHTLNIARER